MNVCILSGRLVRNAITSGTNEKALLFTVATKYGFNASEKKERIAFVPCVLFDPSKELVDLFKEKGKGLRIECEGRVANSRFEVNGEVRYKTDVILRNGSLTFLN